MKPAWKGLIWLLNLFWSPEAIKRHLLTAQAWQSSRGTWARKNGTVADFYVGSLILFAFNFLLWMKIDNFAFRLCISVFSCQSFHHYLVISFLQVMKCGSSLTCHHVIATSILSWGCASVLALSWIIRKTFFLL